MTLRLFKKFLFLLFFFPHAIYSSEWITPGPGNWSNPANWDAGVPNSFDAIAQFFTFPAIGFSINVDIPVTVNTFSANNNNPISFNNNSITFTNNFISDPVFASQFNLNSYNFDFILNAPTNFRIFSTTTISTTISGIGSLTKNESGTLILSGANNYSGGTNINSGVLQISADNNIGTGNIIFNGGTLRTTSSFTTAKTISLASSGIIDVNPLVNFTVSSLISGVGSLTKTGNGSLILTNNNNYSGDTNINGGILQISDENNLGNSLNINFDGGTLQTSASLNITKSVVLNASGGTFSVDPGTFLDIQTPITAPGIGSLSKTDTGTLTLSSSNTYTGSTNITAGTLVLSGASNTSNSFDIDLGAILRTDTINTISTTSLVIVDGTFNLNSFDQNIGSLAGTNSVTLGTGALITGNDASDTIFSGNISGTGSLSKVGIGTFTLSGINTYSGATFINNGVLQAGIADIINNSSSVIMNGATFDLDNNNQTINSLSGSGSILLGTGAGSTLTTGIDNNSSIFSGTISQTGNLIKEGTGKFTLSGNNTYTGNTNVNTGNLAVLGSISSPLGTITVEAPAILSGNGIITGTVINYGHIRPGASIGILTVSGEVTFNNGSVYQVEFDPTSSDLLDVIGVPGTVTITADSSVELIPDFSMGPYSLPQTFRIIQTVGGVTGQFSNNITAFPDFIGKLVYDGFNVDLLLVIPFSQLVTGGNPGSVAAYFDSLPAQPDDSDLQFVINALESLSEAELIEAFDQLHPAIFKGQALVQQSNTIHFKSLINQRIANLYNHNCLSNCFKCKKASFWISPFYENYIQKNIHNLKGFDSNTEGFAFGADNQIYRNNYLGILGGYSFSNLKWNSSRGKSDINSFYLGLYYSWFNKNSFINTSLAGSFNNFEATRNIDFTGVSRTAKNNHNGKDANIHFDGGLIFSQCRFLDILPFASIDYFYMKENGFTETGANSLNLEVKKSNYHLLRSEIGSHFNRCFFCNKGLLIDLKLSYIQETRFNGRHYTSNLVYQPGDFVVSGIKYNKNIFSPGLTISKVFSGNNLIVSSSYNGEFGKKYINNNVSLMLTKNF